MITRDERRLAARDARRVAPRRHRHDLGQHETAATLFGFAAAEQDRLDITLRPSVHPLVEAREACRAALGAARFDELAAQGANTEWRAPPDCRQGARHEHAVVVEAVKPGQIGRKPVAGCPPTGVVESESCQPEPTRIRPATKEK